ncbi:MAG: glycosyltransferase family 4 protein [Holophagales bacterium]|nr:glycosyltransferase family 4 protein [Holophagales bacterium]
MRILIVSNTYPPADISGVGSLVHELAHSLGPEEGYEVRVLTRDAPENDSYAVTVGGEKGQFLRLSAEGYLTLLQNEGYDLIHVHESDGFGVVFLWWLARLFRRPSGRAKLVATLQVSYSEERRMVQPLLVDGQTVSFPTADEWDFANRRAPMHSLLGKLTVRLADAVVAPSEETKRELIRDYKARNPKVIRNGIDVEAVAPEVPDRSELPADQPVVLYVGRIRTRKAVAVLLHAFRTVLARYPAARLRIVGGGEQLDALRALLQKWQREEPALGKSVEITGPLPREETWKHYAEAEIYCLPSLYEGFPLAILEAMAAGLPVVATDVSGNPEAVDDGATGLLVPRLDSAELAEALCKLIADPARRRRMGLAGREKVERDFDIQKIAGEYVKLWQDLLANRD